MSDKISSNVLGKQESVEEIPASTRVAYRAGLFVLFLIYALALELPGQGLDFCREVWIDVHYHDRVIGRKRVDFEVEGVMVEIKARAQSFSQIHN